MFAWNEIGIFSTFTRILFYFRLKRGLRYLTPTLSFSFRNLLHFKSPINFSENDLSKIKELRNSRIGRRCVIAGGGPSLKKMDLSVFMNDDIICSNGGYKIFIDNGITPKHLIVEDVKSAYRLSNEINHLKSISKIIAVHNAYCIQHDSKTLFFRTNYQIDSDYWHIKPRPFSKSFHDIVYLGGTVLFISLQWAYYLGYTEVYLIGVDHSYGEELDKIIKKKPGQIIELTQHDIELLRKGNSSENYMNYQVGQRLNLLNYSIVEESLAEVKRIFEGDNRRIYNIGLDSKLPTFEILNYKEIFP